MISAPVVITGRNSRRYTTSVVRVEAWPASRAISGLKLPVVQPGPAGSVHLLLAGYAQVVHLLALMPPVIRRPPGPETDWWVLGALRPVVKTLVTQHLRRRLAALSGALQRAA